MSEERKTDEIIADRKLYERTLVDKRSKKGSRKSLTLLIVGILAMLPLFQVAGFQLNYILHLTLYTFMYIAMASSWNILGGYTGYVSLGHNLFFCIGGYFSGMILARYGISSFITAPLAGGCSYVGWLSSRFYNITGKRTCIHYFLYRPSDDGQNSI